MGWSSAFGLGTRDCCNTDYSDISLESSLCWASLRTRTTARSIRVVNPNAKLVNHVYRVLVLRNI